MCDFYYCDVCKECVNEIHFKFCLTCYDRSKECDNCNLERNLFGANFRYVCDSCIVDIDEIENKEPLNTNETEMDFTSMNLSKQEFINLVKKCKEDHFSNEAQIKTITEQIEELKDELKELQNNLKELKKKTTKKKPRTKKD